MQVDRPITHQTEEVVDNLHLDEICSPAVRVTCVAFLVTVIVYLLVFSYYWGMDKIIWLYLSNTNFLLYKGRRSKGEGMTYNKATTDIRNLVGPRDWVRFPVVIRATPLMLREGKAHITDAKEFVRTLALLRVQQEEQVFDDTELTSRERAWWLAYWWCLEGSKDSSPARKQHPNEGPMASVSKHLELKPLEGSFGWCLSSDSDPQTYTGDDSNTSHQTTTSNRDHHWDRAWWWAWWKGERGGWRKTNWGKLSLPIFRDSQKDDAISYDDWRCKVDALMQRGHSPKKIKMAVLDNLEGRPKRTAQVADTDGKGRIGLGKLYKILDVLENSYVRSVTYQSLIGELCSILQKWGETPKSYY